MNFTARLVLTIAPLLFVIGCGGTRAAQQSAAIAAMFPPPAAGPVYRVSATQTTEAPPGLGLNVTNDTGNLMEVAGVDPVGCAGGGECEGLVQRWVIHHGAKTPALAWLVPPGATARFAFRRPGHGVQVVFTAYAMTDPPEAIGQYVKTYDEVGFRNKESEVRGVIPF